MYTLYVYVLHENVTSVCLIVPKFSPMMNALSKRPVNYVFFCVFALVDVSNCMCCVTGPRRTKASLSVRFMTLNSVRQ